jgi:hypothetical protein
MTVERLCISGVEHPSGIGGAGKVDPLLVCRIAFDGDVAATILDALGVASAKDPLVAAEFIREPELRAPCARFNSKSPPMAG